MNSRRGKRLAFVRPDGAVCVIDNRTPKHPETAGETLAPLSGLREIYVEIAQVEPEIEQDGLKTKQIERYLDRKFKEAGIKRLSQAEFEKKRKDWAALYVYVGIIRGAFDNLPDSYAYGIQVQLHQDAFLLRRSDQAVPVVTWWTSGFGCADSVVTIRLQAEGLVDEFINAYLSVNPN